MEAWPTFKRLLLRVQEKYRVALAPIQSSSIDLFSNGKLNSVRLCLTLDRTVGYHQVHKKLLSTSGAVELVKTSSSHLNIGYVPIYSNGKFAPAGVLRHPRCDVMDSVHILMLVGKIYCVCLVGKYTRQIYQVFPTWLRKVCEHKTHLCYLVLVF